MRFWETPVLIPNTMVKTQAADGTLLETARESRWLPDLPGGIAQLGERLPCKQEVTSSNLVISTKFRKKLNDKNMYLENYILKMIRHQTVKKQILLIRTHFFTIKMTGPSL